MREADTGSHSAQGSSERLRLVRAASYCRARSFLDTDSRRQHQDARAGTEYAAAAKRKWRARRLRPAFQKAVL